MRIDAILNGLLGRMVADDSLPAAHREEAASATGAARPHSTSSAAALREAASGHDVTNLSPRQFSELVQELHDAGAISDAELKELAAIRLALDESGLDPDEPLDMVDFFQSRLDRQQMQWQSWQVQQVDAEASSHNSQLEQTARQLEWLKKFALLHQRPDQQPVDALV